MSGSHRFFGGECSTDRACIPIAIRLDSRGPILVVREYLGLHNKPIRVFYFRTIAGDNQQTGVGRVLTALNLHTVPHTLNVIKGDMSLIGPALQRIPEPDAVIASKPGLARGWREVVLRLLFGISR